MSKLHDLTRVLNSFLRKALIVLFFVLMHAGAIWAFWFFSWQGMVLAVSLYLLSGFGISIGYHRLLTHESFETFPWMEGLLGILGALSMQGKPLRWIARHRQHHQYSDKKGDPHSPRDGSLWSHIIWIIPAFSISREDGETLESKYVPDLIQKPLVKMINDHCLAIQTLCIASIVFAGWMIGGWYMMWSLILWGVCFRVVSVMHITWAVNSICHMWGYRNYQTKDKSRNNPLVALVSFGEGWHNNHHHKPTAANHGQRWWEIDFSYWVIVLMKKIGLARKVQEAVWKVDKEPKS